MVGVGGVIIDRERALLIRRGSEPLLGEWSIPGGTLELGETLEEGVARELLEETGLTVRVIELIEVFDRIYLESTAGANKGKKGPRFHYVIVDEVDSILIDEARIPLVIAGGSAAPEALPYRMAAFARGLVLG